MSEKINARAQLCYRCRCSVAPGAGFLRKSTNKWLVICQACAQPSVGNHRGWHEGPLGALDLETTGTDVDRDRILTAALVQPDDSVQYWLINPEIPIPARATAIHGLDDAFVQARGVSPSQALSEIVQCINEWINSRVPVVIMNARFDLSVLYSEFARHCITQPPWLKMRVVDPLILDFHLDKLRPGSRRLEELCQRYGVTLTDAHNASADACAAREVARAIAYSSSEIAQESPEFITGAQRRWRHKYFQWRAENEPRFNPPPVDNWPIKYIDDPTLTQSGPRTGNSHQKWTNEEKLQLSQEFAAGQTWVQIAATHGRSPLAIHSQAQKLGLIPWDDPAPR